MKEKPLEKLVENGGFCGIFRKIACIGDSLLSGAFETTNKKGEREFIDFPEYSWGRYIERTLQNTVCVFSRGGMTAKEYCESFAESKGFWNRELACQAYIIALGANDLYWLNHEIGDINDIDITDYRNNKKTITGYYGMIIQRYKEIQPDAKFFLITLPLCEREDETKADRFAEIQHQIAGKMNNVYILDFRKYAPVYDTEFKEKYYLGDSHMNPMGYMLTSKYVMSYIDHIVRYNTDEFKQVGLIGTNYTFSE